ncbi:MAG: hypothetical protein GY774_39855 [Planctomycetes bacterium]|nr:hypothetical protein [Planctomycetota bacterium]
MGVTSGFMIVKTFERMYRDYLIRFEKYRKVKSGISYDPIPLEQMSGKYRGIARNPIAPWIEDFRGSGMIEEPTEQELDASLFMNDLTVARKAENDFIFELDNACKLLTKIHPPVEREIIWARRIDKNDPPPPGTEILGYEPIDFDGDFSSLIAHVLFFRYGWTADFDDPDGVRAKNYYSHLNKWGLFDTPDLARRYVDSFPLLPEHERPEHIAEVRVVR